MARVTQVTSHTEFNGSSGMAKCDVMERKPTPPAPGRGRIIYESSRIQIQTQDPTIS